MKVLQTVANRTPLRVLVFYGKSDLTDANRLMRAATDMANINLKKIIPPENLPKLEYELIELGDKAHSVNAATLDIVIFFLSEGSISDETIFNQYDRQLTVIPEEFKQRLILVGTGPEVSRSTSVTFFGQSLIARENLPYDEVFIRVGANTIWNHAISLGLIAPDEPNGTDWSLPQDIKAVFDETGTLPSASLTRTLAEASQYAEDMNLDLLTAFLNVISFKPARPEDEDQISWLVGRVREQNSVSMNPEDAAPS